MESLARLLKEYQRTTPTRGLSGGVDPRVAAEAAGTASPVCPLCDGARFVRVTSDPEHPLFGQAVPCECVRSEDARDREERLLRYSRLGALSRMTFATLLPEGRSSHPEARERYRLAVDAARRYAERPEGWLVLLGMPGCGKTHLAAAIAGAAIEGGTPALFLPVADLLDELRASYDADAALPYERLAEQIRSAPLLVLDDLDAYAETAWAREKFFQLVSHRFHAALPTVFTCTRAPEQIEERLAARLTDPALSQVFVLEERTAPRFSAVGGMTRERLADYSFERFRPGGHGLRGKPRQSLEEAFRGARQWAEQPEGWLVLLGGNGCGKTHLAAAIANFRLEQGDSVCFANVPDLLDELRASFAPDAAERYDTAFARVREAPLLILDDLGAHHASPWAQEKLYQVLNHRHLRRLPTVITMNGETKDLEPRIRSRLSDLQVSTGYEITAPDYRVAG